MKVIFSLLILLFFSGCAHPLKPEAPVILIKSDWGEPRGEIIKKYTSALGQDCAFLLTNGHKEIGCLTGSGWVYETTF